MTPTVICRSFRFSFRPALALNIQTHVLCLLTLTSVDVWMCLTSDGPHRGKVGGLHEQSRTPFSGPTRSCDVGRPLERKKIKSCFHDGGRMATQVGGRGKASIGRGASARITRHGDSCRARHFPFLMRIVAIACHRNWQEQQSPNPDIPR